MLERWGYAVAARRRLILAAAFSGARFVGNQQASASMAMAVLTGIALLCYLANLLTVVVPPAPAQEDAPEQT